MISIFSFQTPATILDKRNVAANVHANSNIEACTVNIHYALGQLTITMTVSTIQTR